MQYETKQRRHIYSYIPSLQNTRRDFGKSEPTGVCARPPRFGVVCVEYIIVLGRGEPVA